MRAAPKILVVDDDPVIGKSFDRVLAKQGYVVMTARDGQEALSKLATEEYDVVFTDIKMPGMNGLEVAERVKTARPWTPVVIITGHGSDDHRRRAEAAGVSEFLHKPLSPEAIEGSAHKALQAGRTAVAAVAEAPAAAPVRSNESLLKSLAMFLVSPFIGLAYMIAFPFFAGAMLAGVAREAAEGNGWTFRPGTILRHGGMVLAAPFLGFALIAAFPVVGLALLAWYAGQAVLRENVR